MINYAYTRAPRNGRIASRPLPFIVTELLAGVFFLLGVIGILFL